MFQELEEIHIDLANTLNGAIESHALLLLSKVSSVSTHTAKVPSRPEIGGRNRDISAKA